jgi:hypothetical protein
MAHHVPSEESDTDDPGNHLRFSPDLILMLMNVPYYRSTTVESLLFLFTINSRLCEEW